MQFTAGSRRNAPDTILAASPALIAGGAYGSYELPARFYAGAGNHDVPIPRYRYQGCRTFTNKPPC